MRVTTKSRWFDIDLNKAFASGGEGSIIKIDLDTVAKIYHQGRQPLTEQKLIELSVLPDDLFVKPLEILYHNSIPIGYTMQYLDKSSYMPLDANVVQGCSQEIIDKLCKGVTAAHDNDIVIGDLNLLNVMVNNNTNEIKFIDVDSYQTKSFKHSGIVLQEISDKQRNSEISKEADCFSLAVCCFLLFTKVHPFKGMHNVYKNDYVKRMLNKLPIISGDESDIKVPKMFVKPSMVLQDQFKDLFINGKRFVINIKGATVSKITQAVQSYGNITSRLIDVPKGFKFITFDDNMIIFNYDDHSLVYNLSIKKFVTLVNTIKHNKSSFLVPKNDFIYKFDEGNFTEIKSGRCIIDIKEPIFHISQDGDMFYMVTENNLFKINLSNQKVESIPVHGLSFENTGSLLQNITNDGKSFSIINAVKITEKIEMSRSKNGLTFAIKIENNDKKVVVFENNKFVDTQLDTLPMFNFNNGMFTIPQDGKIKLMNKNQIPVMDIDFNIVGENTFTIFSPAGLVVVENSQVYLLNTI